MTPADSSARIAGAKIRGLNCPGCGAAMNVRGFEHTISVVCPQCLSILNARDPNLQILQEFKKQTRQTLAIPLGSRGSWQGTQYEVIGFQRRGVNVEGTTYGWSEYLLFNPYKGFRYFTEYNGHWNFVRPMRALPQPSRAPAIKPHVVYEGVTFTHFSTGQVVTSYVLGEFPWLVKRGEKVFGKDYIAPPRILSSEETGSETTWSAGEYVDGKQIWSAFKLPGAPPRSQGIYLNQPSPWAEKARGIWGMYWTFLLAALAILMAGYVFSSNDEVFSQSYRSGLNTVAETSFVTPIFELKGRPTNIEVDTRTDLENNWAYFNYSLINAETGQAYDFGREVSYYQGSDSDGSWSEGGKTDEATLSAIPSGRYYLRVEPELAPGSQTVDYAIRVRRDVAHTGWFWLTAILLLIPPALVTFRKFSFDTQRWKESDYAPVSSSSDDGDD